MSTLSHVSTTDSTTLQKRSLLRSFALEAKYELLKTIRVPAFAIPVIAFPSMFYILFGLTLDMSGGQGAMSTYLLASYGAFGVVGAALFSFGVGVAIERGQGWMLLKRASPMPIGSYLAAKMTTAAIFSCVVVVVLFSLGLAFGNLDASALELLALAAVLVGGTLPFCAIGLFLGYLCGPNSAPAIVNIIYLPTAFMSGMWIPIQVLPEWIQGVARYLPMYHFNQLAHAALGTRMLGIETDPTEPVLQHVAVLVATTLIALGLAYWAYLRDEGKTYG